MADAKGVTSTLVVRMRQVAFRWRTGIGCGVSFFMMTTLILVTSFVRAFFWEGKNCFDEEIRGRAMYTAYESTALASEYIVAGNRDELHRRLSLHYTANEDSISGRVLLYLMIYNKNGKLLIGKGTATDLVLDYRSVIELSRITAAALGPTAPWVVEQPSELSCRSIGQVG
jgi:hypothetical protein